MPKPYLYSAILLLSAVLWHVFCMRLAPKMGLIKPNFRQQPIIASYGIALYGWIAALGSIAAVVGVVEWGVVRLYLAVCGAMCLPFTFSLLKSFL